MHLFVFIKGFFQQYEEHKPRSFVVWGIQHEETNQTTTFLNNTKDMYVCMNYEQILFMKDITSKFNT
jgi:hypothetical protein